MRSFHSPLGKSRESVCCLCGLILSCEKNRSPTNEQPASKFLYIKNPSSDKVTEVVQRTEHGLCNTCTTCERCIQFCVHLHIHITCIYKIHTHLYAYLYAHKVIFKLVAIFIKSPNSLSKKLFLILSVCIFKVENEVPLHFICNIR